MAPNTEININEVLNKLEEKIDTKFTALQQDIFEIKTEVVRLGEKVSNVDKRLDGIEKRLDGLDGFIRTVFTILVASIVGAILSLSGKLLGFFGGNP